MFSPKRWQNRRQWLLTRKTEPLYNGYMIKQILSTGKAFMAGRDSSLIPKFESEASGSQSYSQPGLQMSSKIVRVTWLDHVSKIKPTFTIYKVLWKWVQSRSQSTAQAVLAIHCPRITLCQDQKCEPPEANTQITKHLLDGFLRKAMTNKA